MGTYLARQSGDVLRIWEEGLYDSVVRRTGEDLLYGQGFVLGGCDVGDFRVLERPFPAGHYILHEVNSYTRVGRQVLVAVNSQKATQTLNQSIAANLLVDLLLALVLGSKALRCHLRVGLWPLSLCHSKFGYGVRNDGEDKVMIKIKPILF